MNDNNYIIPSSDPIITTNDDYFKPSSQSFATNYIYNNLEIQSILPQTVTYPFLPIMKGGREREREREG